MDDVMKFNGYHLAQMNIAKMLAPIEDPLMEDFVAKLNEINRLADNSAGFIWRFQSEAGDATYLRPYEDDRIIFNMSVWNSIESLKKYVYESAHAEVMKNRRAWFEKMEDPYSVLWWIKEGHIPDVNEAKWKLEYFKEHGASSEAFTYKKIYDPNGSVPRLEEKN